MRLIISIHEKEEARSGLDQFLELIPTESERLFWSRVKRIELTPSVVIERVDDVLHEGLVLSWPPDLVKELCCIPRLADVLAIIDEQFVNGERPLGTESLSNHCKDMVQLSGKRPPSSTTAVTALSCGEVVAHHMLERVVIPAIRANEPIVDESPALLALRNLAVLPIPHRTKPPVLTGS